MKKRGREKGIHIHLSNRLSYTLIAIFLLAAIGIGVYALTPGVAPNPGHLISDVAPPSPCTANQFLQFNGSNWKCSNISVTVSTIPVYSVTNTYCVQPWGITTLSSTCPAATVPAGAKGVTVQAPGCLTSATWYYGCSPGQFATCAGQTYCANTQVGNVLYG